MYTVASERTKYHAKLSRIERIMVRKRFGGDRIVSKSGRKVACLQKLFTIHHSLNYCSFRLISGAFESDRMCADAVHFKFEIWSLIHFLWETGYKSALSACQ